MSSDIGSTKQAANCPKGVPAPVKVGEFGEIFPGKKVWTTKPLKLAKVGDVLLCVVGATTGKINLGIVSIRII